MLGAIVGDIIGSRFEWNNIKTKEFDLFTPECKPTDDSIMTLAIAKAILSCDDNYTELSRHAERCMQEIGRQYPDCGYGGAFEAWVFAMKRDSKAPRRRQRHAGCHLRQRRGSLLRDSQCDPGSGDHLSG